MNQIKHPGSRRRRLSLPLHGFLLVSAILTGFGLLILTLKSIELPTHSSLSDSAAFTKPYESNATHLRSPSCATVEEMGEEFATELAEESLRVRRMIHHHFLINGAPRIRNFPPEQFCRQGFVLAKASEAGLGNEMYKILSAAALSIMLNRSLIIGQTRHIGVNFLSGTTFPTQIFHLL